MLLVEEVTTNLSAFEIFRCFEKDDFSFFLDSGVVDGKLGRYSFTGSEPFLIFRSKGKKAELIWTGDGIVRQIESCPFELLRQILDSFSCQRCSVEFFPAANEIPQPLSNLPPFLGGAVGYFAYDLCHFIEDLPSTAADDINIPDCYIAFYNAIVAVDQLLNKVYLCACGFPESEMPADKQNSCPTTDTQTRRKMNEKLQWLRQKIADGENRVRLKDNPSTVTSPHNRSFGNSFIGRSLEAKPMCGDLTVRPGFKPEQSTGEAVFPDSLIRYWDCNSLSTYPVASRLDCPIISNFTRDDYLVAVRRAKEYIAAGDIYQVNLSQRFTTDLKISPFELYMRLRMRNPAPFAAYLNFDDVAIVSSSPERFLLYSEETRSVHTRPIKGTRPRGATPEEDRKLANELLNSEKDRAELLMIIDLERNDLGRVCEIGTVRVPELIVLEKYATVYHLVSTVVGKLPPDKDRIDLLKATFPGGSITGAPKIRSMEIIDELEPTKRSVYTGAIGYLCCTGNMDVNIVIRTFIINNGKGYFQVGGGIVADSEPEAEYQETLDKAKALFDALLLDPKKLKIVD